MTRTVASAGSIWRDVAPLFALSALAICQPLLDLFGRSPEFFVANDLARPDIVVFALFVGFVPPSLLAFVLVVLRRFAGERVGDWWRGGCLAALAGVFGLGLARTAGIDSLVPAVAISLAVAALTVVLVARSEPVALLLRYLGLAPIGFVALFLLVSPVSRLVRETPVGPAPGSAVGSDTPVVMVMLDEVPVTSLMTTDLEIDDGRFPNFARLAAEGTWYRNAASVAPFTVTAVPAALTGELPPGEVRIPNSVDHPRSLFTLLGESHRAEVTETITEVCPPSVCAPAAAARGMRDLVASVERAVLDSSVVLGHATLPEPYRGDLPPLDEDFAGFIGGGDTDTSPADASSATTSTSASRDTEFSELFEFLDERKQDGASQPDLSGETLRDSIARFDMNAVDQPPLFFVHESFPHFPWERAPSGARYRGEAGPPGVEDKIWQDDEVLIRQAFQRHELQVGYADTLVGELIDRMQREGMWDDALVVVVADHGISFTAGESSRSPTDTNATEVYRVPLFVKYPGQVGGGVDDRSAMTIDILPTVVDVLAVDTDWSFDGRSLLDDPRPPGPRPVQYSEGPETIVDGTDALLPIIARNHERVPVDGIEGLQRVGRYGAVVGRSVEDFAAGPSADWSARLDQPDEFRGVDPVNLPLPVFVRGVADFGDAVEVDEALVAIDGVIAGVVGFTVQERGIVFRGLVGEAVLTEGDHTVSLYEATGPASRPTLRPVQLAS